MLEVVTSRLSERVVLGRHIRFEHDDKMAKDNLTAVLHGIEDMRLVS